MSNQVPGHGPRHDRYPTAELLIRWACGEIQPISPDEERMRAAAAMVRSYLNLDAVRARFGHGSPQWLLAARAHEQISDMHAVAEVEATRAACATAAATAQALQAARDQLTVIERMTAADAARARAVARRAADQ